MLKLQEAIMSLVQKGQEDISLNIIILLNEVILNVISLFLKLFYCHLYYN